VIINDLGPYNLVYATAGSGEGRLVLVDGFGEKTFVPLCSMSKRFNRWNTWRKGRRLLRIARSLSINAPAAA
jgi:hypothetical protein